MRVLVSGGRDGGWVSGGRCGSHVQVLWREQRVRGEKHGGRVHQVPGDVCDDWGLDVWCACMRMAC